MGLLAVSLPCYSKEGYAGFRGDVPSTYRPSRDEEVVMGIRRIFAITLATSLLFGVAVASGGDRSLVSPSQPHGILSTAMPAGPNYYPVRIIWLDGQYLSTGRHRTSYWVSPGEHEIGFSVFINPNRGPSILMSPALSQPQNLRTMKLMVRRGWSYYFAAEVPHGNPSHWRPVIIKKVPGHAR